MTVWSKFTAWFSSWPESKERKQRKMEINKLFEEVELKKKVKSKKPKGLNPKKKKSKGKK